MQYIKNYLKKLQIILNCIKKNNTKKLETVESKVISIKDNIFLICTLIEIYENILYKIIIKISIFLYKYFINSKIFI